MNEKTLQEKIVEEEMILLQHYLPICQLAWKMCRKSVPVEGPTFDDRMLRRRNVSFDEKKRLILWFCGTLAPFV